MPEINWDDLDYSDPCALHAQLYPAYLKLASGERDEEVEIDGRRVRFARASLPRFEKLIKELQAQCVAKNSGKRARRAALSRHY